MFFTKPKEKLTQGTTSKTPHPHFRRLVLHRNFSVELTKKKWKCEFMPD